MKFSGSNSFSKANLITHITNNKNEIINFEINESQYGEQRKVAVKANEVILGEMRFTLLSDHLFINRMDNYTIKQEEPLKRVGSTLFEYAFRRSVEEGLKGKIELESIEDSPVAYFKMGLRKMSDPGIFLRNLISNYEMNPTKDLLEKIQNHTFYESLKEDASVNLAKSKNDISFEEAIKWGMLDPENKNSEEKLNSGGRVSFSKFMRGRMYIPDEIREQKITEFDISNDQLKDHSLLEQNFGIQELVDKTKEKLFIDKSEPEMLSDLNNTFDSNLIGDANNIFNPEQN